MFSLSSRQALLPGSDLPNYHLYKEAETFNKSWLVPSAASPTSVSSVRAVPLHLSVSE